MFPSSRVALTSTGLRQPPFSRRRAWPLNPICRVRQLLTLAIETSCDETSVAILEKHDPPPSHVHSRDQTNGSTATLHFLENVTAESRAYKGIHPLVAHESHQDALGELVNKALRHLPKCTPGEKDTGNALHLTSSSEEESTSGHGAAPSIITHRKPDFITVTRGPGMRACLVTGLDTAKGLSVAWQIPLVGVHHMQAHLLTPKLVSALRKREEELKSPASEPDSGVSTVADINMPFLSILVSGGHTLLVHSKSTVDHSILGDTMDMGIGQAIDKLARFILPQTVLEQSQNTMYGKALEAFAFPNGPCDYADYEPPARRQDEALHIKNTEWGWELTPPCTETRELLFSFSGIVSSVQKYVSSKKAKWEGIHGKHGEEENYDKFLPHEARVALARDVMHVCFEHLASRIVIALESIWEKKHAYSTRQKSKNKKSEKKRRSQLRLQRMKDANSGVTNPVDENAPEGNIGTLVVSGGVAANHFLRTVLRSFLDKRGFQHVQIVAPPPKLCTDNAAMIGWVGMEMFEAGWRSSLGIRSLREWSLDASDEDGGVLGPEGWVKEGRAERIEGESAP